METHVRFIIEFDGPVADIAAVCYEAFVEAAGAVGWSKLDQPTFWRLVRTKGWDANLLPGARPIKIKEYQRVFAERLASDHLVERYVPRPGIAGVLRALAKHGACSLMTTCSNVAGRRKVLERAGLSSYFDRIEALNADPRRRPAELAVLAEGDRRTIVAAAGDILIRAAGEADLFAAGISNGAATKTRLQQAGADVVYADLQAVADSLAVGAPDMIRAGLLPPPLS